MSFASITLPIKSLNDFLPNKWQYKSILKYVENSDGYVSGGYAAAVLDHLIEYTEDAINVDISTTEKFIDLFSKRASQNWFISNRFTYGIERHSHKADDIDITMPSRSSYEEILKYIFDDGIYSKSEMIDSKYASSFKMQLSHISLQLLHYDFSPPERRMLSFDLVNSMVSFKGNKIIFDERYISLRKKNMLAVNVWPHDKFTYLTLTRMSKYIRRKRYECVSDDIQDVFEEKLKIAIEQVKIHSETLSPENRKSMATHVRCLLQVIYLLRADTTVSLMLLPEFQTSELDEQYSAAELMMQHVNNQLNITQ